MPNFEGGMSPGEELAQHQEQVKFRLGERRMAYRELWTPVETEEEQRLLEAAAIEQFTEAVNAGDWTRADAIAQDLRRQFGEPLLEVPPVAPEEQEKPEPSAIEKELHDMIEPYLEKAILSREKSLDDLLTFFETAAMRDFDPEYFDTIAGVIAPEQLKRAAKEILYCRDDNKISYFLREAIALKKLVGPKGFAELIPMDDEHWKFLCQKIKTFPELIGGVMLSDIEKIAPGKIKKYFTDDELSEIKRQLSDECTTTDSCSCCRIGTMEALHTLKQEGEKVPQLSQKDWERVKSELEDAIRHQNFEFFFRLANMVKKIGVEEE